MRSVMRFAARVVAEVAVEVRRLAGCQSKKVIDGLATALLTHHLINNDVDATFSMRLCEGIKDNAPIVSEQELGSGSICLDVVCDPVECTGALSRYSGHHADQRGSMVILAVAPFGSLANLYSGCRAKKMVLPPGVAEACHTPVTLDTPPADIVFAVCKAYSCSPDDVRVHILNRNWNRPDIQAFARTGARVIEIESGDFEGHILASQGGPFGGPQHVSYGIGGLPEGILAVPSVLMTGGTMLLRPDPLKHHQVQTRAAGCAASLGRDYTATELIRNPESNCFVVWAGVTSSSIARGVTFTDDDTARVEVGMAYGRFSSRKKLITDVNVKSQVFAGV